MDSNRAEMAVEGPGVRSTLVAAGSGVLIRGPRELVFLPDADPEIVTAAVGCTRCVHALTGLAQEREFEVAPFVAIEWDSSIRIVVFGNVEVRSDHPSMPRLSGAGSGTWVERTFPADTQLELSVNGEDVNPVTDLREGVVEASGFVLALSNAGEEPRPDSDRPEETEGARTVASPTPPPTPEPAVPINAAELVARVLGGSSPTHPAPSTPPTSDGAEIATSVDRPGWALRFENGETEFVDAVLVLGRSPRLRPTDREDGTRLIMLDSTKASTNHLEVRALDNEIVITDLESRNGSFMVTSGDRQLVQLSPGEPYRVGAGTAVQIGTQLFSIERTIE